MPSQKNIDQVKNIKINLEKSKSVVVANYKGLNVEQMTSLKKQIKQAGGEFLVIKNTLLKIALTSVKYPVSHQPGSGQTSIKFTGPTAILYSYEDELVPLKILYEFFKNNDLPKIKYGFLNKDFLKEDKILELAQLPSQDALKAKLVGVLNSPIYGLVYVLKANLSNLIRVINNIKEQKMK